MTLAEPSGKTHLHCQHGLAAVSPGDKLLERISPVRDDLFASDVRREWRRAENSDIDNNDFDSERANVVAQKPDLLAFGIEGSDERDGATRDKLNDSLLGTERKCNPAESSQSILPDIISLAGA